MSVIRRYRTWKAERRERRCEEQIIANLTALAKAGNWVARDVLRHLKTDRP
jgi:uncharacterized membrane protein YsdA (DUF1294 family)